MDGSLELIIRKGNLRSDFDAAILDLFLDLRHFIDESKLWIKVENSNKKKVYMHVDILVIHTSGDHRVLMGNPAKFTTALEP